ncbi:RNA polymerase sigma-70 factor, ECF subfamily [Arenibacter nanhaiticus]|uniref:RNA polymerase sigma factor n=1 Tax=Arenibacter nanhaiticus TaxID=558155 RepID=A0A1M6GGU4_9FLAO|nr:RNA polymerase sigma-70 factor [Arenibacter nanhaiticus]SHJ09111.1 RNA polymerase sigma-70 factor, ECF subfamily [Arenibacter nanhaiticus]
MTNNEDNLKELLVLKLKKGDKRAFQELFERYQPSIYAYSLAILKSKPQAEEIVQDVFLKVWLNREKLDPSLSLKAYIFTIARNLAFNLLVKSANNKQLREAIFYKSQVQYNTAINKFVEDDYEQLKNHAIEKLPPRCKLVFLMSRNDGKSYEEIARDLDISVNTVKYQINKALTTIKEFLSTNGDIVFILAFLIECARY